VEVVDREGVAGALQAGGQVDAEVAEADVADVNDVCSRGFVGGS
jgi:hypothetical protein